LLAKEHLRALEVHYPESFSTTYHGYEVLELPPINQGMIAMKALNIAATVAVPAV
jgi:gamma-glutamyltranspeptidase